MPINIFQTLLGGFAASIVWFVIGGGLYMNPWVARIYKNSEGSPALKKWPNIPKYIGFQYLGILIQCFLWALIFVLIKSVFPEGILIKGFFFGLLILVVKIFPRFFDTWVQSTYPNKLLAIEFINGAIGGFIIGVVFAYIIA